MEGMSVRGQLEEGEGMRASKGDQSGGADRDYGAGVRIMAELRGGSTHRKRTWRLRIEESR